IRAAGSTRPVPIPGKPRSSHLLQAAVTVRNAPTADFDPSKVSLDEWKTRPCPLPAVGLGVSVGRLHNAEVGASRVLKHNEVVSSTIPPRISPRSRPPRSGGAGRKAFLWLKVDQVDRCDFVRLTAAAVNVKGQIAGNTAVTRARSVEHERAGTR